MGEPEIRNRTVLGYRCTHNVDLGHLTVFHNGDLPWDKLQEIKSFVWGADARAIEVYPADKDIVNAMPARHLWRLAPGEFCPDLLGRTSETRADWHDSLEARFLRAWQEAHSQ